ncbi:NXPE family member 4-like [Discoglossus pictus]
MKCPEHAVPLEYLDTETTINSLVNDIGRMIPSVHYTHMDNTTSAKNSKATLIKPKDKYCIGDTLIFLVEACDYFGKRKHYGGDFVRARIYSPELQAGASGNVEDFGNGTYRVMFTLFWEGKVTFSILLHHPSEGVAALWRVRNKDFSRIYCEGQFAGKGDVKHTTDCAIQFETKEETCDYLDKRDGESFYCVKPSNISCDSFTTLACFNTKTSSLTTLETEILASSNIAVEIPTNIRVIDVHQCHRNGNATKPKCKTGMSTPFPGGYFFKNIWNPLFCELSSLELLSQAEKCLTGKMIYLFGDSTLRQWYDQFKKLLPSLKFFNIHENGWHSPALVLDVSKHISISWKKHGHPFLLPFSYTVKTYNYVAREIDHLPGGPHTIIVVTLGHHFRPFPLSLLIRRLLNMRKAVERILLRSPGTKVIFKSENTRQKTDDVERTSDFQGYTQYLVAKTIFKGLDIGMIDAWDMTNAFGSYNLHPSENIVNNQINLFLAYVCKI